MTKTLALPGLFDVAEPTAPWSGVTPETAETSREAAAALAPALGRLEQQVYDALDATPSTCDEVEQATGLSHQTCSARVNGLLAKGRIRPSGQKRTTRSGRRAVVWEVARG